MGRREKILVWSVSEIPLSERNAYTLYKPDQKQFIKNRDLSLDCSTNFKHIFVTCKPWLNIMAKGIKVFSKKVYVQALKKKMRG